MLQLVFSSRPQQDIIIFDITATRLYSELSVKQVSLLSRFRHNVHLGDDGRVSIKDGLLCYLCVKMCG